jgi:hypothetical protein
LAVIFLGLPVPQAIDGIHRIVLHDTFDTLEEPYICMLLNCILRSLCLSGIWPIGDKNREAAFQ